MASRLPGQPPPHYGQTIDGLLAGLSPVAPTPVPEAGLDIAVGDWDNLFDAVKGRLIRTVFTPDTSPTLQADLDAMRIRTAVLECVEALEQLHATVNSELARRDGLELEVFDAKASLVQIRAALLGTQEGERRALHLAAHDGLTLLPNLAALVERITHEQVRPDSRQRSFAVMVLELDGFKSIIDAHGHAAGDELLQIAAARLSRVVRAQDLVSRTGADEFACLIGGLTDYASLAQLADKMADAISAPCVLGRLRLTVQVSIGIAVCPADGSGANTLLGNAYLAMAVAKRQQVRYGFFSPDVAGSRRRLRSRAPERPQRLPE